MARIGSSGLRAQTREGLTRLLETRSAEILRRIEIDRDAFYDLPDEPGKRIHALFTGLYLCTTEQWLAELKQRSNAELAHLVILRFYDEFERVFKAPAAGAGFVPDFWKRYFRLAGRTTMEAPISTHLMLLFLGARAHTRHDLSIAIRMAIGDFEQTFGYPPDLAHYKPTIESRSTDTSFYDAVIQYIDGHLRMQSSWRRSVLQVYLTTARALDFVWLPIFQSWRAAAWKEATTRTRPAESFSLSAFEARPGRKDRAS